MQFRVDSRYDCVLGLGTRDKGTTMQRIWKWLTVGSCLACCSTGAVAQSASLVPTSEYARYLWYLEVARGSVHSPLVFRSHSAIRSALAHGGERLGSHAWGHRYDNPTAPAPSGKVSVAPIHPTAIAVYNSEYPRGVNDGAVWAGKGLTTSLTGGVEIRWGPLTGTVLPTVFSSANHDFPTAPVTFSDRHELAYAWNRNIDWPQRMGTSSITEFDWGQSGIRLDLGGFTTGFTTENMSWGPSFQNPIIMSTAAPGFPHLDLGTGRPVETRIGRLEVRAIWGQLQESDYFDSDPENDKRYITGLALGYEPSFLPGLRVGLTRVLYQTWPENGLGAGEIFDFFGEFFNRGIADTLPDGTVTNDPTDQMVSAIVQWSFPEAGFQVYLEWARGDFNTGLRDLTLEPEHTRAYTLGFQKTLSSSGGDFLLRAEHTTLGNPATRFVRGGQTLYTHNIAEGGYTHKGQLVGAAIGPAGQSQFLGLDRYMHSGRWGVFLQRVRFNDDYYFDNFDRRNFHDTEITIGGSMYRFLGPVDAGVELQLNRRLNWHYVLRNDATNVRLQFNVGWRGE